MAGDYITRRVSGGWTWFEDYLFVAAAYACFAPPGRTVQVGMGVWLAGGPRGGKLRITEQGRFIVVGAGAIHVRLADGGPDCEVAITRDTRVLVPIVPLTTFP